MIDFSDFFQQLKTSALTDFEAPLKAALDYRLQARDYGEIPAWQQILKALPNFSDVQAQLDQDEVSLSSSDSLTEAQTKQLTTQLMGLHPWRKGPFNFFGTHIDTEWRSDWKWQRIAPHISDLNNRTVLDVGCGSGYHCWRMRGQGAAFVLGIDPTPKNVFQFQAFKRYIPDEPVHLLPLRSEDMPSNMPVFDTVFSMGVLYHRRSPFDHLEELKNLLRPGGELVLETLVVDGDEHTVMVPDGRYAQMRNVWFLPSAKTLKQWLARIGFKDINIVNVDQTSTAEQRSTEWMTFHSLSNFLDPEDANKTVEGHPAPKRAFLIAKK